MGFGVVFSFLSIQDPFKKYFYFPGAGGIQAWGREWSEGCWWAPERHNISLGVAFLPGHSRGLRLVDGDISEQN